MSRDYQQFPDDDNGNVLWQMAEDGDDLTVAHAQPYCLQALDEQAGC